MTNPLFTTEDDVDIFEGDSYWYIQTGENNGETFPRARAHFLWQIMSTALQNGEILDLTNTNIKRFSTKSLAEEYRETFITNCLAEILKKRSRNFNNDDDFLRYLKEEL